VPHYLKLDSEGPGLQRTHSSGYLSKLGPT